MEKKVIEAAVWAFVKNRQLEEAVAAALKSKDPDEILEKVVGYYLRKIKFRKLANGDNNVRTLTYLNLAYNISGKILSIRRRRAAKERTIMKGLACLKKLDALKNELVEFLYKALSNLVRTRNREFDAFIKKMVNAYLGISRLEGREIFKIAKLMSSGPDFEEAKRLLPIFINRGDYEALRLMGKKYGVLEKIIVSRSREIILSCLKRGNIEDAVRAISLMTDGSERRNYCQLLSVDCASLEEKEKN